MDRRIALMLVVLASACASSEPADTPANAGGAGGAAAGRAGRAAGESGKSAAAGAGGRGGQAAVAGASGRGGKAAVAGAGGNGKGGMGGAAVAGAGARAGGDTAGQADGGESGQGTAGGDYWRPKAGLTWQWQLSEDVSEPLDVAVYDIDWEAAASDVELLHAQGIFVICYVSVGSWEDFRSDAGDFPDAVIGNDYDGWPGEKYLDIRADAVRTLMLARFDVCVAKGFDAIEPDNMDVFELGADSGFPLARADGIAYAEWLAAAAHARGLGIGQKNTSSITAQIHADYDWALTEGCYGDGRWCDEVSAYLDEDKPVFMCEYEQGSFADACAFGLPLHYSPILKTMDLDASVTFCP